MSHKQEQEGALPSPASIKVIMKWNIVVKNPRKPNGDLGDKKCSFCGGQSGAYIWHIGLYMFCKKCLQNGIDAIDKAILEDIK